MYIEIITEPDTFEIGNPQIFTTEFGAALVERHNDGIYTARVGTYTSYGTNSAEKALEVIRRTMRTLAQFNY